MIKNPIGLEQIMQNLAKMEISLNLARVGITHVSFTGDILWANPFYLDQIGYTLDELKSLNICQLSSAEDSVKILKAMDRMRTGEIESFELDKTYIRKDGSFGWANISSKACRAENGEPQFIVAAHHDINKRKEFESLLNLVLRAIPSLVSYLDKDLKYRFVNQSYEKWFGIPYKDVVGKNLIEVIGKEAFDAAYVHTMRALKGEYVEFERRANYQFGGARDVFVTYIPDFDPIGEVKGFVVVVTDITELKTAQNFNEENIKQVHESAKRSAIQALSSAVSHQISPPLDALYLKIDQMRKRLESIEGPNAKALNVDLVNLKKSTQQILKVAKGLNFFSRNEAENRDAEQSLLMILEDAIAAYRDRLEAQGVELIFEGRIDFQMKCNAAEISQVFFNLLENSYEAIEKLPSKWIKISLHEEANRILIYVTDSGPGLCSTVFPNLMSPFFTTKKSNKVSGLGLSEAGSIIEKYGGKLYYDSSNPHSCFVIELSRDQNCVTLNRE